MSDIDEQILAGALRAEAGRARGTAEGWDMVVTQATKRTRMRRRWIGGSATLVAAAAAAIAIALFAPSDSRPDVVVQAPATTVATPGASCSAGALDPRTRKVIHNQFDAVAVTPAQLTTARAILSAVIGCDYDGLRTLMAENFTYDFGATHGAVATIGRWQDEEARGLHPLKAIADALTTTEGGACTYVQGSCIWLDSPSHLVVTISPDGTWKSFDVLSYECPTRGGAPREPVFADGAPDAVKEKARAILAATIDCDFRALQGLMAPGFRPDFDAAGAERAINLWIVSQHERQSVLEQIVGRLTEGAPTVDGTGVNATYLWEDPLDANPPNPNDGGCHCGFRVGIAADGSWQYALAGD